MVNLKCITAVMLTHLIRWSRDCRVKLILVLLVCILFRYLGGLTVYGLEMHTSITPFILPILFAEGTVANGLLKVLLYLGWIALICGVPYKDLFSMYVATRSNRINWLCSYVLLIFVTAFFYTILIAVVSALIVLPITSLTELWGSTISGLMNASAAEKARWLNNLVIPQAVTERLYPEGSFVITFFTAWLSFWTIGMLMLLFNYITNSKRSGITLAVFLVLLDPIVTFLCQNRIRRWWYYLSPVNWSSIENWDITGLDRPLTVCFVVSGYLFVILCAFLALISRKKKEISWEG